MTSNETDISQQTIDRSKIENNSKTTTDQSLQHSRFETNNITTKLPPAVFLKTSLPDDHDKQINSRISVQL